MITAREAARLSNQANRIRLIEPVITLNSEGARKTRVQAEQGLYDETSKVLRLETGVKMQGSNGFRLHHR